MSSEKEQSKIFPTKYNNKEINVTTAGTVLTFNFVDATHLISKANLWKERDKIIKAKYEKLNNETLHKVAHDKEARIGC